MSNLGSNFYPKLVQISSELGMKPEDLLCVMVSESGINPSAHEKKYGASGLIQFMPSTLKSLNYKGTPEDFRKLTGEDQLDWVKKLIKSQGTKFTSATQFYISNFFPAALSLPGVKKMDMSYAFIEKNPQTVKDSRGNIYSKKYYDVGIKLHPSIESGAYKANPAFHGTTANSITVGDMDKQVQKNKQNPLYKKAIQTMMAQTNYTPSTKLEKPQFVANHNIEKILNKFLSIATIDNPIALIKISSDDLTNNIELSRVLSSAIEELFNVKTSKFNFENNIEIECDCNSLKKMAAIEELAEAIAPEIGSNIQVKVLFNEKSQYKPLPLKLAMANYREFLLRKING